MLSVDECGVSVFLTCCWCGETTFGLDFSIFDLVSNVCGSWHLPRLFVRYFLNADPLYCRCCTMFSSNPTSQLPHLAARAAPLGEGASTSTIEKRLLIPLMVGAAAAVAFKLYRVCVVRTSPSDLSIVYDVRRRAIFSSSSTPQEQHAVLPRPTTSALQRLLRRVLRPGATYVLVPPGGLHAVFAIPRSALSAAQGITTECIVEDVQVSDGTLRCVLSLRAFVDAREIDRYLSVVGPVSPVASIGRCVAACLREELQSMTPHATAATLLHRSSYAANSTFMTSLRPRVQSRLVADCCVVLKELTMERVELSGALDGTIGNK